MKQLSQLVEDKNNKGKVAFACSVNLKPTKFILVSYHDVLSLPKNKEYNLLAVKTDDGTIPPASAFMTLPTYFTNGIVVFDTLDECMDEYKKFWRVE